MDRTRYFQEKVIGLMKALCSRGCRINYGWNTSINNFPLGLIEKTTCHLHTEHNFSVSEIVWPGTGKIEFYLRRISGNYCCECILQYGYTQCVYQFDLTNTYGQADQNRLDMIVHFLYTGKIRQIPTQQNMYTYRNNLMPVMYKNCFGSELSLYMHLFNMYVPTDIKKIMFGIISQIDKWDNLEFYCAFKNNCV